MRSARCHIHAVACIAVSISSHTACSGNSSPAAPSADSLFTSAYESWPNGPSTEAAYFPLGVWVQSPANAAAYREIGINLYVGLWQGPTQQQLDDLTAAGMQTICSRTQWGGGISITPRSLPGCMGMNRTMPRPMVRGDGGTPFLPL